MRYDAILALVCTAACDHDHLALCLAQVARLVHQRVMVGEEGAELLGPISENQENIGNETGFLLDSEQPFADIRRHVRQGGNREAANGGLG
jgi:hypothetical protein